MSLLVAALTLGATTSTSGAAGNQDLGHGVTADSVKIGFAVVDYDAIKDFVDYNLGDEKKVINTFVDYLNKNGGIDGRKIVPDIKEYPPIPGGKPDPLSLCTSWAEDDDVFAVLGVFIDFTGQGQLCLTKEHDVVHIGYELDQPWIDEAKGGLLLTPDETKEQAAAVVVNLLAQTGKLKGKTVAVMGDKNSESRVNDIVVPALKKAGAKAGSTAIVTITGTDTTAAQSQLDSFIEKWKSEGVNTVFLAGNDVSAKQFAETIKHSLPKVQLVTDTDTTHRAGPRRAAPRARSRTRTKGSSPRRASRSRSGGPTRTRCSSSASTSTRRRPARPSPPPTRRRSTAAARRCSSTWRSPTSAASCSCSATSPGRWDRT